MSGSFSEPENFEGNKILIHERARENFGRAIQACYEALNKADDEELRQKAIEMKHSLEANFAHLFFQVQGRDGTLMIWADDTDKSFFWRYAESGYHGGLIFHKHYVDGEATEYGSWSIHT